MVLYKSEFEGAVAIVDHVLVKRFDGTYFESDTMKTSITDRCATFANLLTTFLTKEIYKYSAGKLFQDNSGYDK